MRSSFYTYGEAGGYGSNYQTLQDNELVVMFGSSPVETRMGGTGQGNNLVYAREKHNLRIINIDPRLNDTAAGDNTEWIPIRTGTDAALCAALSYEIINNGWLTKNSCTSIASAMTRRRCLSPQRARTPRTKTTSWALATT